MDSENIKNHNKEHIWSDKLSKCPDATEYHILKNDDDARDYVEIISKRISGVCGNFYEVNYLKSDHSSEEIFTVIKTTWRYLNRSGSSTKQVSVLPKDEKELGCTGWQNPTGADTTYSREILSAWFED